MATRDGDDPLTRIDRGRTRTPETMALSRLAAGGRQSAQRPWYASWWVPVAVVAVMLVLLVMVAT